MFPLHFWVRQINKTTDLILNIKLRKVSKMFDLLLVIAIILFILWALGAFAFSLGGLVYIALVLAVILLIIRLAKRIFRAF